MSRRPDAPVLLGRRVRLRGWRPDDAPAIVPIANDRRVWRNLTERFPHPYTLQDAHDWIAFANEAGGPARHLAIEARADDGPLMGSAGFDPLAEGEGAEIGYWLGAPFWGRGYATEALALLTDYAFAQGHARLEAGVFAWNPASMRVLEKVGYRLERIDPRAVHKDGQVIDRHVFVRSL